MSVRLEETLAHVPPPPPPCTLKLVDDVQPMLHDHHHHSHHHHHPHCSSSTAGNIDNLQSSARVNVGVTPPDLESGSKQHANSLAIAWLVVVLVVGVVRKYPIVSGSMVLIVLVVFFLYSSMVAILLFIGSLLSKLISMYFWL